MSAAAAAAALCLLSPVAAAGEVEDVEISPGHTLVLQPEDGRTYSVKESESAPLPAGWSVITEKGALRITAPATAAPSESATIEVKDAAGGTETFDVRVEDETPASEPAPSSSSSSGGASAWLDRLAGRVASFFGS